MGAAWGGGAAQGGALGRGARALARCSVSVGLPMEVELANACYARSILSGQIAMAQILSCAVVDY